jgi:hypothetical protein
MEDVAEGPEWSPEIRDIPIFLGEGADQIQIGVASIGQWNSKSDIHKKIVGQIDVLPGAVLTFSRVCEWQEVINYSKTRYPKE